jgi:hypothetical protein
MSTYWLCRKCGERSNLQAYMEGAACKCGGELGEFRNLKVLSVKPLGGAFEVVFEEGPYQVVVNDEGPFLRLQAPHEFHQLTNGLATAKDFQKLNGEILREALLHSVLVIEERRNGVVTPIAIDDRGTATNWTPHGEGVERRVQRYFPGR